MPSELSPPLSLSAGRDAMTRAVFGVTISTLGAFTVVALVLLALDQFSTENLWIVLASDAAVGLLSIPAARRAWRFVAAALPVLFLLLASFLTYLTGPWSPSLVFFVVPVVLGFTLLDDLAEWLLLGASLALYGAASWLHGERGIADIAGILVTVAVPLVGAVLLLRFSRARLRDALAEAQAAAARLSDEVAVRLRAEQSMRDLAEKSRAVFQSIDDAVVLTDLDGTIVDANDSAARLLRLGSPRELLDKRASAFAADPDTVDRAIHRIASGSALGIGRIRLRTGDGRTLETEVTGVLYRDSSDRPAGVACVVRDVTARLLAEAELRHTHKMRAVGQLSAGVAHEINNLLLAIRGYAELARQEIPGDAAARGFVDEVLAASGRAEVLVGRLVAFGRSAKGQPRVLDLNEALRRLAPRLAGSSDGRVAVDLLLAPDLWPAEADSARITQAVEDLCRNARDAMPEGGRITLETANVSMDRGFAESNPWAQQGRWVSLRVSDTGTGMSPETLDRLFEPFYTTKGPGKGTGLSLATVYEIVRSHRGFIHVSSTVGLGSSFTIYLRPAAEEPPGGPDSGGFDAGGGIV